MEGALGAQRGLPAGQAEVRDDRLAALVEKDVGRLEVAVGDPLVVGVLHGRSDGADDPGGLIRGGDRPGPRAARRERRPWTGSECRPPGRRRRWGRCSVGGGRRRSGPRGRTDWRRPSGRRPGGDRCNRVVEGGVGRVDGPHAPGPEAVLDPVPAERGPGLERDVRRGRVGELRQGRVGVGLRAGSVPGIGHGPGGAIGRRHDGPTSPRPPTGPRLNRPNRVI